MTAQFRTLTRRLVFHLDGTLSQTQTNRWIDNSRRKYKSKKVNVYWHSGTVQVSANGIGREERPTMRNQADTERDRKGAP